VRKYSHDKVRAMTFKEEHKEEFHEEQEGGATWPIIVFSRLPPVPVILLGLWMVVDGDGGCLSLTPWSHREEAHRPAKIFTLHC